MTLAITTLALDFSYNSPFRHMIPPLSDVVYHPVTWVQTWFSIFLRSREESTKEASRMRSKKMDDAIKRMAFQREHHIKRAGPMSWFGVEYKGGEKVDEPEPELEPVQVEARPGEATRKKWLGIW